MNEFADLDEPDPAVIETVDVDLAPDPLPQLNLALSSRDRWRRAALTCVSICAILLVLSSVQLIGTLITCNVLQESRKEADRVHRETAESLQELQKTQQEMQLLSARMFQAQQEARLLAADAKINAERLSRDNVIIDTRVRLAKTELEQAVLILGEFDAMRAQRDRIEKILAELDLMRNQREKLQKLLDEADAMRKQHDRIEKELRYRNAWDMVLPGHQPDKYCPSGLKRVVDENMDDEEP